MNEHTATEPSAAAASPSTQVIPVDVAYGAATAPAAPPAHETVPQAQERAGAQPRPYVTIVLPCFNEGEHVLLEIDRITAAMNASEFTYELLCIDDASTDNTLEVLHDAASRYANIRVMPFRRNGGSGTARRIGTQQAHGEIVVWTDADMTYENERIPDLVRILRDDETYDQVVGARTSEEGTHKWARVPAKWLIRKIAERLSNQKIPDLNSGLGRSAARCRCPTCGCCPPASPVSRRSRWRSCRTSTTSSTCRPRTPSGRVSRSSTSPTTPTATSSRCCGW